MTKLSNKVSTAAQHNLPGINFEAIASSHFPISLQKTAGIDLSGISLSQDFGAVANIKRIVTTVPVRKPNNQTYVRIHPGQDWRISVAILQLRDDGECYLVMPNLFVDLAQEVRPKMLYTGITRDGNVFLWPINLPSDDGRLDAWSQSAHMAAEMAEASWVRLVANRTVGAYDLRQAVGLSAEEPSWPELTFSEIVDIAFRDKVIDSLDHPILRRLRGEL